MTGSPSGPARPRFADEVEFLRRFGVVHVLRAPGCGPVAISPLHSGRVMTSALADDGPGFGFVNRPAIEAGRVARGFANWGGEDRLWLSPEGGPQGLFFDPGAAQELSQWFVPTAMDGEPWPTQGVVAAAEGVVRFAPRRLKLVDWSGGELDLLAGRRVEVLSRETIGALFGSDLPGELRAVGFRSVNSLQWAGTPRPGALVGLWSLGQFPATDATRVVLPIRVGADEVGPDPDPSWTDGASGRLRDRLVKSDYFGTVPDERLDVAVSARSGRPSAPGVGAAAGLASDGRLSVRASFRTDGRQRGKIGLARERALGWACVDHGEQAPGHPLSCVFHPPPPPGAPVPDCAWLVPNPRAACGDVITSYNHAGPPRFFELETLSAALRPSAGARVEHVHATVHLDGPAAALEFLARRLREVD